MTQCHQHGVSVLVFAEIATNPYFSTHVIQIGQPVVPTNQFHRVIQIYEVSKQTKNKLWCETKLTIYRATVHLTIVPAQRQPMYTQF